MLFVVQGFSKQIVFQKGLNGYDGVSDTYLNGYHKYREANSYGGSEVLNALGVPWGGLKQPTLIRFESLVGTNPNQIPEGAVITSARLELYKIRVDGTTADYMIYAHQMLRDWNAGTAVDTMQEGSTCYQYHTYSKNNPEKWGTEEYDAKDERPVRGKDYISNPPVASLPIGTDLNVWMSFDVTNMVQQWVSGEAENHGLLLRAGGYWVGAAFFSSEVRDQKLRPKLVVEYEEMKEIASDNWKLHFVPASLNKGKTLKFVPGYTQTLNVMMQAKKQVTDSAPSHKIDLILDLPEGAEIVETRGYLEIVDSSIKKQGNRNVVSYCCIIKNSTVRGEPGTRVQSEWNGHFFAVRVPSHISPEDMYIKTTVKHNGTYTTEKWPVAFVDVEKATRLDNTRIALWDYGMNFSDTASIEVGKFLADMGVNHMQRGSNGHAGYKANGVTTGGYLHQSVFYNERYLNYDVSGNPRNNDFCDPQAVINSNGKILDQAIQNIVAIAQSEDGMVTVDYEPSALEGFSQLSINEFKKQYQLSDAEFEELRNLLKTYGLRSHTITDERRELYLNWVRFRTWQTESFARIINERIKSLAPSVRLQITTNATCGDDNLSSLARGGNSAEMGKHIDAIMPQTYRGYGKAEAKFAILEARQWKNYVDCELYPILLIRYAGATPANSPLRVRQQLLGVLAEGADGAYFYYPQLMDATYWAEFARTTKDIAIVEDFYQKGNRCDELFRLSDMPISTAQISAYPNITFRVENPDWHFTAHEKDEIYCLTLFNLKSDSDLAFDISTKEGYSVIQVRNGTIVKNESNKMIFSVTAEEVAIVLLEKK